MEVQCQQRHWSRN